MCRTSEEYWDLTPREIHACVVQFFRFQDLESFRFGTIAATLLNVQRRSRTDRVYTWMDFFKPHTKQTKQGMPLEEQRRQFIKNINVKRKKQLQSTE